MNSFLKSEFTLGILKKKKKNFSYNVNNFKIFAIKSHEIFDFRVYIRVQYQNDNSCHLYLYFHYWFFSFFKFPLYSLCETLNTTYFVFSKSKSTFQNDAAKLILQYLYCTCIFLRRNIWKIYLISPFYRSLASPSRPIE